METGERYDASALAHRAGDCTAIDLSLEPAGTRCFVLTHEAEALPPVRTWRTVAEATVRGEFLCNRDEPNVCVLDWTRWLSLIHI